MGHARPIQPDEYELFMAQARMVAGQPRNPVLSSKDRSEMEMNRIKEDVSSDDSEDAVSEDATHAAVSISTTTNIRHTYSTLLTSRVQNSNNIIGGRYA